MEVEALREEVARLKEKWAGFEFDSDEFAVDPQEMVEYALAVGEVESRFVDPQDPDFQAVPTFAAKFISRRRVMPEGFPPMGRRSFDAGKCVTALKPIRGGVTLRGRSSIADIYLKTGRTGPMMFVVHRMEFVDPDGDLASVVDWRMVEKKGAE